MQEDQRTYYVKTDHRIYFNQRSNDVFLFLFHRVRTDDEVTRDGHG